MKIIKACKIDEQRYFIIVESIPKITFEKVGVSYAGLDTEGYFSTFLKYGDATERYKAFGGAEIKIEMKDGTTAILKDNWWDAGTYDKEHEYISVGLGTLKDLQECFVFKSYNINKDKLNQMLVEYLENDIYYKYDYLNFWCNMQYEWHRLAYHGQQLPFMVNYKGHIIEESTKKRKYALYNCAINKRGKSFRLKLFKLHYKDGDRLIKLEDKYENVMKESLPESMLEKYKEYLKAKESESIILKLS